MQAFFIVVLLMGGYPLLRAWRANRGTSLLHAVHWALLAWLAWLIALAFPAPAAGDFDPRRYLALALTGCAGVAVLGARRPHAGVWNFVVLGLLGVMVLPLAESLLAGPRPLDKLRVLFLAATLAVSVLNYLPTRFAPAALLLALGCTGEVWQIAAAGQRHPPLVFVLAQMVGVVPWAAWVSWSLQARPPSQFDLLWLDFRNRYGLVWGQRVREQFNRAAENAGWPARLYWQGLHLKTGSTRPDTPVQEEMLETLQALLRRFY